VFFTGIGISFTAATAMRRALIALAIIALACHVVRAVRRAVMRLMY
jgi:hypothetical protein